MVLAADATRNEERRTLTVDLTYRDLDAPFDRADVVFQEVDHSGPSFEVRLFFNNPDADADTPRSAEEGYAGRFTVFGHGGCYGDIGHCDVPAPTTDPTDLRPAHPLTPLDTYVTVTGALRRLADAGEPLQTVTLVPVVLHPNRRDNHGTLEPFNFSQLSLHTYLG
jgi:hypothetical protein